MTKVRLRLYAALMLLLGLNLSLSAQRNCSAMDVLEHEYKQDPNLQQRIEEIERHTQQVIRGGARAVNGVITIPVVFHIVYNTAEENISDAQIQSQIDILNEDFRRLNADAVNTPADFQGVAADVEIQFCLASTDPNGFETIGITRTFTNTTSFPVTETERNNMKFASTGGKDAWPASDYLNFWVCDLAGGILGFAQFPGMNPATDGVVCDYLYTGNIGTATAPYDLGRTGTHEVGHYLNLRHIWGDGNCGLDDGIADTPLAGGSNGTGPPCTYPGPNSCDEGPGDLPDMFQNYMDYSQDACMNLYTEGQKSRMRALFEEGGARESLLSSPGCDQGAPASCDDGLQNGDETGVDCGGSDCVACPTCDDGIQNGQETDIDCGGNCSVCPTCDDGIKNGDEEGVDCGGPDCSSCNGCFDQLDFSDFDEDFGIWIDGGSDCRRSSTDAAFAVGGVGACVRLRDNSSSSVMTSATQNLANFGRVRINFSYLAVSMDNANEDFWLQISTDGGTTFTTVEEWNLGDEFENDIRYNESLEVNWTFTANTQFRFRCDASDNGDYVYIDNVRITACDGNPVEPTCTDGIQNGQETGVDCGGPDCPDCPTEPTCDDGIQNGQETGVDCGGPDCPDCPTEPTCDDGIQNGQETGVDCGGPDCPDCPTEPTCDDGIQNGQETGVDCGGPDCPDCPTEPTCDDGIQNGQETGVDCGGPDCPDCPVEPTCNDGIQNGQETGIDCGGPDCVPCSTDCTVQEIDFNDFNSSYGIWNDGGSDCTRSSADAQYAVGGVGAPVRLRDNSSSSVVTTDNLALLTYQEITVNFSYLARSMDNPNEDFWLQISTDGGASFTTVEEWNLGDEFENDIRYNDAVTISGPFSNQTQIRFRCDASSNTDYVYLDDIRITGCNSDPGDPTCTDGVQNGQETGVDCGGPDCPTCPTCDDGIQNGGETGVDCGGPDCPACPTEPSCTDGIQNGNETGVDCGGPDCPTCPTCDDGILNGNETGIDCGGPDCVPCSGECTTQLIDFNDFNSSYGIWNDGGSDCTRSTSYPDYAVGGTGAVVRLRDNSSSSVMTTDDLNLSAYQELTVDFTYVASSMDNANEDFWLQISTDGGATFNTVEEWNLGDEFENETRYFDAVTIPGPFTVNTQVRFRCDASSNTDYVYIDDVSISGCVNGVGSRLNNQAPAALGTTNIIRAVGLYPNPTRGQLTLSFDMQQSAQIQLQITDISGKLISKEAMQIEAGVQRRELNADHLRAGVYFMHITSKDQIITKRFVVIQ